MIHSLSGGVIAANGIVTFAKVETAEGPLWYVAPMRVAEGDLVMVPVGRGGRAQQGKVVRVETCTPQTAPVPLTRAREIVRKCPPPVPAPEQS